MKHKETYELLNKINIPVAYDHFEDNKSIIPPFIVYREQSPDYLYADDNNYCGFNNFEVELVTLKKDISFEEKIETLFKENNIPYSKSDEDWDEVERIYHIFYEI